MKKYFVAMVVSAAFFIGCSSSVNYDDKMTEFNNNSLQTFDYLKDKSNISFLIDSIEDKFNQHYNFVGEFPNFEHIDSFNNIKVTTYLYLLNDTLNHINMTVNTTDKSNFRIMKELFQSTEKFYSKYEHYSDSITEGYIVDDTFVQISSFDATDEVISWNVHIIRFEPDLWKKQREEHERLMNRPKTGLEQKIRYQK